MDMEKKDLKKLTKGQLIKLLLKKVINHEDLLDNDPFKDEVAQEPTKPTPPPRTGKWESVSRKSVNEDGYKPIPKPRTDRPLQIPKIKELNRALKGHEKSYEVELQDNLNPLNHFTKTRPQTESHLEDLLKTMKGFKFIETLEVTFEKDTIDSKTGNRVSIYKTAFFNGKAKTITKVDDTEPELNMSRQEILNVIDKLVSEGSGWVIDRIDSHYLNVTLYKPLNGSSYMELPTELRNPKKGLIDMKNKDEECFRWRHIRHLNPQTEHPERIKKEDKKMINELNYDGINFPLSQKHYNKVEKQSSIRINVFGYENGQPFPIHISKETFEDQMNLLLITKDEKKHYVLIKDFNAFMYNQSKHKERKHFCMYCLQCFSSERILANHVNNCLTINGAQAINMPKQGENILKFNNFHKQLPVPFVIYADFEAIVKKYESWEPKKSDESYTDPYQFHEECGFGYKLVCSYDSTYSKNVKLYRGENAAYKFIERMLKEVEYCKYIVVKNFNQPLRITKEEKSEFMMADSCHICGEVYKNRNEGFKDYSQFTGRYRGSAHKECMLKNRIGPDNLKIPVVFHNLRGYDGHFIMQNIGKIVNEKGNLKIGAMPNNMEKYIGFTLGDHLMFIDSFQFMSSSLDKLVSNLPKEKLRYTSSVFEGRKLELMSKKGVYPYDFMDDYCKFHYESLPSKEKFYNILNDKHITDEEYEHAKEVWKALDLKDMGEYHDLYLVSDVLLLTDVFENFRSHCLNYYKLDPCHYFTSPGLSWDAMLRMTGIRLELMTDIDMFQFIEKGMRGGVSYIANRYGNANNKYMKEYYEKAPSKYIMCLDANNLYG